MTDDRKRNNLKVKIENPKPKLKSLKLRAKIYDDFSTMAISLGIEDKSNIKNQREKI